MSVLRDALKRQEQERKNGSADISDEPAQSTEPVEPAAAVPPLPPTDGKKLSLKSATGKDSEAETPAEAPCPTKTSHDWVAKVLVLGALLLLVAIAGALFYLLRMREAPPSAERTRLAETLRSVEETVTPARMRTADDVPAEAPATPIEEAEPAVPPSEVSDANAVEEVIEEATVADPPPAAPPTALPRSSEPVPAPAPEPVVWPDIRIQAAMGHGEGGSVLINGGIVPVGETHRGVRIIEITERGVRLEYRGEQRLVPVRR